MRLLFIVGSCLKINTSANLCHIAYIEGCIRNRHSVDVLSMSELGCEIDKSIKMPKVYNWYTFDPPLYNNSSQSTIQKLKKRNSVLDIGEKKIKKAFLYFYNAYGRTYSIWAKRAIKFYSENEYDYVISLATPYVSHYVGMNLKQKGRIKCKKFIQIWEDPWSLDLYNKKNSKKIMKEEKKLLASADKIVYVSPITLKYQSRLYSEYSKKMLWVPLPYYYKNEELDYKQSKNLRFGYYGDYFSFSRDLRPFYEAAKNQQINVKIYGNSDLFLEPSKNIVIKPRVGLKDLSEAEQQTDVLVFLCNLKGGQIPGKIYQYSATNKKILFILDGSESEISVLENYFKKFNRYIFCKNNVVDIEFAIKEIEKSGGSVNNSCVEYFSPESITSQILKRCKYE